MTSPCCLVCGGASPFRFSLRGWRRYACQDCGLIFVHPQPDDEELRAIYSEGYHLGGGDQRQQAATLEMKRQTARLVLGILGRHARPGCRLFELGCGRGHFMAEAQVAGYEVSGADIAPDSVAAAEGLVGAGRVSCGVPEELGLEPGSIDVAVLLDVIEHLRDPVSALRHVRRWLAPDGLLMMVTPSLDSLSSRFMGRRWVEYKDEHLFSFGVQSMRRLLEVAGFAILEAGSARKVLSLEYVLLHFERFPLPGLGWAAGAALAVLPEGLLRRRFVLPAGGMFVVARGEGATGR